MKKAAGDLLNFLILAMLCITFKNFHSKTLYIYCVKYSELLFTCKAWLIRWNKTSLGNKRQSQRPQPLKTSLLNTSSKLFIPKTWLFAVTHRTANWVLENSKQGLGTESPHKPESHEGLHFQRMLGL